MRFKIYLVFMVIFMNDCVFSQKTNKLGQSLFKMQCSNCHGIQDGAFGPKLGGIHVLRDKKDFRYFVQNTNAVLSAPDVRTKALMVTYKAPMPEFNHLSNSQVDAIYQYIKAESILQKAQPLSLVTLLIKKAARRYAAPVKPSKLYIELEKVINIPRTKEYLPDKGINTLRSTKFGLFVGDQMGQIYQVQNNKATLYFDVKKDLADFIIFPSIGAGLGSFAFHPDFARNGLLYTAHNEKYTGKPAINENDWPDSIGTEQQYVIDEWQTNTPAAIPFKWVKKREVLRINTPTFAHSGQDLTFAPIQDTTHPDYGMLYYGFGDGGTANIKRPELAHRITSILGCILRIDPLGNNGVLKSYGIPADNPYATSTDPAIQKEIYAYGFRNPYRLEWDIQRNYTLLVGDIGEANVEELNVVLKGGDYGWGFQEGHYGIDVIKDKTILFDRPDGGINQTLLPTVSYDHTDGFAICGGYIYQGSFAALKDKYIFGDIVNGRLFYCEAGDLAGGIYDVNLLDQGKETNVQTLCGATRTHMRIGYDRHQKDLYILTKPDNTLRRVKSAIWK